MAHRIVAKEMEVPLSTLSKDKYIEATSTSHTSNLVVCHSRGLQLDKMENILISRGRISIFRGKQIFFIFGRSTPQGSQNKEVRSSLSDWCYTFWGEPPLLEGTVLHAQFFLQSAFVRINYSFDCDKDFFLLYTGKQIFYFLVCFLKAKII